MPTPRRVYLGALVVAALLGGFGLIADAVTDGDTLGLDNAVLMALRTPGDPADPIGPAWLEEAVRDITALGSFSVLGIIVVLVFAYLLLVGKHRTGWFMVFAVVGGTIISTVLKMLFDRPRPDFTGVAEVFTASFPSGHATVSAVVFLTIGAMLAEASPERQLKRFFIGVAVALTLLVGVSRIYLGVHYPTDVLAGWSLGAAWALLCTTAAHFLRERAASA
ncbi:MAG: phosphatase PAP2 family protein [Hyphomicrobiales bacterium]|nr:MAG: phosphatase PAP2 family protein [Hyphomicrobiales bacterium]